jgi:chromosome segregation ATPase
MKTTEELEAKLETVTRERDEARAEMQHLTDERDELLVRVANQDAELRATRDAYNGARTDVPALIAQVRELEAECERMKTFAAQSFSTMIRQEAEQMRAYGLSYEGVRKVLREYDNAEMSFGKVMDLIRAAARAMAEEECAALRREIAALMDDH